MWGWIPGGGTVGTTRWVAGKAKGRPRRSSKGTFVDDLAVFAGEVEREAVRRKKEKENAKK